MFVTLAASILTVDAATQDTPAGSKAEDITSPAKGEDIPSLAGELLIGLLTTPVVFQGNLLDNSAANSLYWD